MTDFTDTKYLSYFDIPKDTIPIISGKKIKGFWSHHTDRTAILPGDYIRDILSHTKYGDVKFNIDDTVCSHIEYEVSHDDPHVIDEHVDLCEATILIYLHKSESVVDLFEVGGVDQDSDKRWGNPKKGHYRAMMFNGNVSHSGMVIGEGFRHVLVIHLNF